MDQPEHAPSFEEALAGLERAVNKLESGDLGLDDALKHYESGIRLLNHCKALLDVAERKVALLTGVDGSGQPETRPFDSAAAAAER